MTIPVKRPGTASPRTLNDLFLFGLYELNVIHADPNPGNFIVGDDLTVGLVDFGCVKRLKPDFVEECRQLAAASARQDQNAHFRQMITLGLLPQDLSRSEMDAVKIVSDDMGGWFGRLYAHERFDFGVNADFCYRRQGHLAPLPSPAPAFQNESRVYFHGSDALWPAETV